MNSEEVKDPATGSAEKLYVCNYPGCGRTFRTKFSCKRHSYTHTNEKQHVCKYCNRKFTLQQHLKEHMYRHTKNKPYVCGVAGCRKTFRHASELSLHRRTHPEYKLRKYHFTNQSREQKQEHPAATKTGTQSPEIMALQPAVKVSPAQGPIHDLFSSRLASSTTESHTEINFFHEAESKEELGELDTSFLEYLLAITSAKAPVSRPVLPLPHCCNKGVFGRGPSSVRAN